MGKYSNLIAAAKTAEVETPENQKTGLPENILSTQMVNQESGKPEKQSSTSSNQKTRKPEVKQTGKTENQQTVLPEKEVNLSIKVSERRRMHWLIEAKKQRSSLTREITEFLSQKFGEPED